MSTVALYENTLIEKDVYLLGAIGMIGSDPIPFKVIGSNANDIEIRKIIEHQTLMIEGKKAASKLGGKELHCLVYAANYGKTILD